MSWADTCGNCGDHRADCECGNWSIVRTIPDPPVQERRENQKKENWIKNVKNKLGWSQEEAEQAYKRIFE